MVLHHALDRVSGLSLQARMGTSVYRTNARLCGMGRDDVPPGNTAGKTQVPRSNRNTAKQHRLFCKLNNSPALSVHLAQ